MLSLMVEIYKTLISASFAKWLSHTNGKSHCRSGDNDATGWQLWLLLMPISLKQVKSASDPFLMEPLVNCGVHFVDLVSVNQGLAFNLRTKSEIRYCLFFFSFSFDFPALTEIFVSKTCAWHKSCCQSLRKRFFNRQRFSAKHAFNHLTRFPFFFVIILRISARHLVYAGSFRLRH